MAILVPLLISGLCAGIYAKSIAVGIGVAAGLYTLMPYRAVKTY